MKVGFSVPTTNQSESHYITYSKGRRDEMILYIHPSRRPSVQSIRPSSIRPVHPSRRPSVPSWSVDSDGAEKTVEYRRDGCSHKTLAEISN
jgi:hypothetical protein